MKSIVEIFSALGARLENFGLDESSRSVIIRAMADNEWFSAGDIRYAVEALRHEILDADEIEAWLSHYPAMDEQQGLRIAIIMAGNIPLVGFFDLMCVLASGNIPCVKPSSKDRVLEEYVEKLLLEIEPALRIERYVEGGRYDAVIATGSDSANIHFRAMFNGIPMLLRGSRHSVAVLSGKESDAELQGLADDIFTYSGLGCRNVSLVFVPNGYKFKLSSRTMCRAYHNNYLQCRALLTMQGARFKDLGEAVVCYVGSAEFPRFLSQINVVEYSDIGEVQRWLASADESLQCVVSGIKGLHSRQVPFGRAQHPTLYDYADERDVMQYLSTLCV